MKGKNFLKVTGILMIIGGAITIIFTGIVGLVGAFGAGAISSMVETEADLATAAYGAAAMGVLIIAAIIGLIGGILELIAGIIGVKNCNKPEKSTSCIVWGFIVLVINLVSVIMTATSGNSNAASIIVSIIAGLALPVLYLIGAFLNKKSYNESRGVETTVSSLAGDIKESVKDMDDDLAGIAKDAKEKVADIAEDAKEKAAEVKDKLDK